jgi:oligoribonuclease NrnB/cAMP/cGMP phosphodiesterase (DHH superfamily)
MKNIRHEETSQDSLYRDIEQNLETIYKLWVEGDNSLRFSIPILCAAKLEAFINVAGKLKVKHWDILERKLSFSEKCKIVFSTVGVEFDRNAEPNRTAVGTFEVRNSLVHPKMKIHQIDEHISQEEYERRSDSFIRVSHPLRSELTKVLVTNLKDASDAFVTQWGLKLIDGNHDYWLKGGSTGRFTLDPEIKG